MGYYAHTTAIEFRIVGDKTAEIIAAWRELDQQLMAEHPYHRSSVFEPEDDQALFPPTLRTLFERLGFEVYENVDETGAPILELVEYTDEKLHNEQDYLVAASEFAEPGWFVAWEGEDGERWRQSADGVDVGETDFDDFATRFHNVRTYVEFTLLELLGSDKSNDWTEEITQLRELLSITEGDNNV